MPDELTAGPDGDARVARVLGWAHVEIEFGRPHGHPPKRGGVSEVPRFTTTGDGMLAMMEWMRNPEWDWEVWIRVNIGTIIAEIHGPDLPCIASGVADTAPLAVARALVAAVEEETPCGNHS